MANKETCICMLMSSTFASEFEHLSYSIQVKDNEEIEIITNTIIKILELMKEHCGLDTDQLVTQIITVQTYQFKVNIT